MTSLAIPVFWELFGFKILMDRIAG